MHNFILTPKNTATFKRLYDMRTTCARACIKGQIIKQIGITESAFYNKLRTGNWRTGEISIINNIIKSMHFYADNV